MSEDTKSIYNVEDTDDLQLSQHLRRRVIKHAMAKDSNFDDPELMNLALKAANDSDKQVLTRTKISSDREEAANNRAVTDRLVELIRTTDTLRGKGDVQPTLAGNVIAETFEALPGQLDVGDTTLDFVDLRPDAEG